MEKNELFELVLSKLSTIGKPDAQGNYTAFCPYHLDQRHPNLKLRPDKGFKCFTCDAKGSIRDLAKYLGIATTGAKETTMGKRVETGAEALELLRQRGLKDGTIAHFQIKPDLEKQAWRYPVLHKGKVIATRYKAFPNHQGNKFWWSEKGKTFPVYGLDGVYGDGEVWLVEGEPDNWITFQAGLSPIAFTGGAGVIPEGAIELLRDSGIKKINIVYDLDKAGEEGSRSVAERLESEDFVVSLRMLPQLQTGHNDINDLYLELCCDDSKFREVIAGLKEAAAESEVTILHPALEVRPELALVTFSNQVFDGNTVRTENITFIADPSSVKTTKGSIVDLPHSKAIISAKGSFLPLASEKVDLRKLKHWSKHPIAPSAPEVYRRIEEMLRHYLFLPEPAYKLVTAWVLGTYFYCAFGAYPFLLFLGLKETGKTNTLFVLSRLCFNAFRASYITSPALADITDTLRGTLLLDQAQNIKGNHELMSILTDSYKLEGGIRRVVALTKSGRKIDVFNSFSPKAFASTDNLPEDLIDRCFTIHMAPAPCGFPDPSASREDWRAMRTNLYQFLLTNFAQVCDLVTIGTMEESRFGELWHPLEVMLMLSEVDAKEIDGIKTFCREKFAQVRYELDDWDEALVSAVKDAPDEVSASHLLTSLIEYVNLNEGDAKPGAKWLGKALQRLGLVKEKFRRREGGQRERFYTLSKEQADRLLAGQLRKERTPEGLRQRGHWDNRYENPSRVPPSVPSETGQVTPNGAETQSYSETECPVVPSVPFSEEGIKKQTTESINIVSATEEQRQHVMVRKYTDDGKHALVPMKYFGDLCYAALDDDWAKQAPPGSIVYTLSEIKNLRDHEDKTRRFVHEAKKVGGAKVVS